MWDGPIFSGMQQSDNLFDVILQVFVQLKNIPWPYMQQVNYEKAYQLTFVTIQTQSWFWSAQFGIGSELIFQAISVMSETLSCRDSMFEAIFATIYQMPLSLFVCNYHLPTVRHILIAHMVQWYK